MITKNSVYTVEITGIGSEGEGVCKIDGFTVFVPFALLGETVEILIVKALKNYGFGKILNILNPSKHRITPSCEHYYKCGGCNFWHADYEYELRYKTQKVKDCIERIGKINTKVNDCIGCNDTLRYRNKAQFPVTNEGIGFFANRSHRLIPIEKCDIQNEINDKIISIVKNYMSEFNVAPYDEQSHSGVVRNIFTRIGVATGEVMVVVVTKTKNLPFKEEFVERLKAERVTSIIQNINPEKTNVVMGKKNVLLYGKEYITEKIGDLSFEISPHSFFQVNPYQTKTLYDKALEYADLKGDEIVFDLYCGIGTITLYLARHAKKVVGIEVVLEAIEDAKRNAKLNNIENADFHVGKAEEMIDNLGKADVVVVDPPRKGCDEKLLMAISEISPKKIVYVSCNPATLARDLNIMQGYGFNISAIQPVDMFPRTGHVESVVLLCRENGEQRSFLIMGEKNDL